MFLIDKYRRKKLERDRSHTTTGLIPLHRIHSMGLVIDASASDWEEGVEAARKFCTAHKIELCILAVNLESKDTPSVLTASDISLLGFPKIEKSGEMLGKVFNFLLCICDNRHFCIEYIAKCVEADMKAGMSERPDDCYDIAVSTPVKSPESGKIEFSTKAVFETVAGILKKIN